MKENIEQILQEKTSLKEYGNGKKNMEIKLWDNLQQNVLCLFYNISKN